MSLPHQFRPRPVILAALFGAMLHSGSGEILQEVKPPTKPASELTSLKSNDPAGSDLIRFENGDVMHGTFGGFTGKELSLIWNRNDLKKPMSLELDNVLQVILNEARPPGLAENSSYLTLVNGDRLPGEIISLTETELTIKSPVIGDLTIPRAHVRSLTPNPFDGELHYAGPYNSDGWMILDERPPKKKTKKEKILGEKDLKVIEELRKKKKEEKKEKVDQENKKPGWIHSGAAFYSVTRKPLAFDAGLPDIGRLRFRAAWKGNLSLTVAFHSDFTRPIQAEKKEETEEEEGGAEDDGGLDEEAPTPLDQEKLNDFQKEGSLQNIPWLGPSQSSYSDYFGTGYTMSLSSYPRLGRNAFLDDGKPHHENLRTVRSSAIFARDSESDIEIRFDRKSAKVLLFVDGRYAAQWHDLKGYLGTGSGIGFYSSNTSTKVRISDIVVSSWSGTVDSARSMEHEDRDIVTLINGTDRYSGEITGIRDGIASLKTSYSTIEIPLNDLSRIEFRRAALTDPQKEEFLPDEKSTTILFKPYGSIEISPIASTGTLFKGHSPLLGEIEVDLSSATLIRFIEQTPDISDWFKDL